MSDKVILSEREEMISAEIRELYNSGNCKAAVEKSISFLEEFPQSYLARYNYTVMHGDYSYSVDLSEEEKKRCRDIGNNGIKALAEDPELEKWPSSFQVRVRNEYYWFFELHQKQYELGLERIALGEESGNYSATVGSSMMARKALDAKNLSESEDWAQKSLMHFKKFEAFSPNWYNINFFGAQSLACLGKYEEALACYKDVYRKQKSAINETEVADFITQIEKIKSLRGT